MNSNAAIVGALGAVLSLCAVVNVAADGATIILDTGRVTIEQGGTSVDYVTDTDPQAGFVAALAGLDEMTWMESSTEDDILRLTLPASGSGTLPSIGSVSSVTYNGATLVIDGVTRTFNSPAEASLMAAAIQLSRLLPSGVALAGKSGNVELLIDLEESWIEVD